MLKKLFTQRFFWLLLIPFIFGVIALFIFLNTDAMGTGTWGINKTVGWAWDLSNFNFLQFILYPIYLVVYGILCLFKVRTNYWLTIIHFGLILYSLFSFMNSDFSLIPFFLTILSFIIFLINTIYSIKFKLKKTSLKSEKP